MTAPPIRRSLPRPRRCLFAHAALACGATAAAAAMAADPPVYRCGNAYVDRPCGSAKPLDVSDPRDAAEQAQGRDVARREQRLAATLEAQRHAREAVPAAPRPVRPAASAAAKCVPSAVLACSPWPHPRRMRGARPSAPGASGAWTVTVPARTGR